MRIQDNPILVNVYRDNVVESCHRGSALVVDSNGDDYLKIGDVERHIYPRSSIKFFQTIPLIESGAAEHFKLTDQHIALACASHSGEAQHTTVLRSWLSEQALSESDLENGVALPADKKTQYEVLAEGGVADKLYHNCSGKHTGMLMLSKFLKADLAGYSDHQHASQQLWMTVLSELIELDVHRLPWERDGCGMPAIVMPMRSLSQAAAIYANVDKINGTRRSAVQRIIHAVQAHPQLIAGSRRCCSAVIEATQGNVMVKTGAEGVYMGFVLDRKIGFSLKIDDGATRASEVALGGLLNKLGVLNHDENEKLKSFFNPRVINSQQYDTGCVSLSCYWDS